MHGGDREDRQEEEAAREVDRRPKILQGNTIYLFQDEYNFQFQEFLPIPSSSMDKLSIKERIIIEVCDFLETWCWFLFAFGLDRSSIQGDFLLKK